MPLPIAPSDPSNAKVSNGILTITNAHIEAGWILKDGHLLLSRLTHIAINRNWVAINETPDPTSFSIANFVVERITNHPISKPFLRATATTPAGRFEATLFDDSAGVSIKWIPTVQLTQSEAHNNQSTEPTGIESNHKINTLGTAGILFHTELSATHLRLTQVELFDQTDHHDNLAHEREWLLHPSEAPLELAGNLFFIEDVLTSEGLIILRPIPLPHARPVKTPFDLRVHRKTVSVHGSGDALPVVILPYTNGRAGRTIALQNYQREVRPYTPDRDARFISNTWGDRSRDARIRKDFLMKEIEVGGKLGVEVLQIDDGWQRGRSANSAEKGGVWNGFWAADDRFWEPHPDRLPNGLAPLVAHAKTHGLTIGLWYAPDSSNDFSNWQRDANQILSLHSEHGITSFKIDGVKMHTLTGATNLRQLYDAVQIGSQGKVIFDHDVTAEIRPGYLGALDLGTIFVENRYTDWHSYWPHHTLRNLWTLAQYIDPAKLRIEFLNNERHVDKYPNDPLAPSHYPADYLFATTMFASPLGWFETTGLSEQFIATAAPLVRIWKQHRDAIFSGTILPIGDQPDGTSLTGFASVGEQNDRGYVLVFRERSQGDTLTIDLNKIALHNPTQSPRVLTGEGSAARVNNSLIVTIPSQLRYVLIQL